MLAAGSGGSLHVLFVGAKIGHRISKIESREKIQHLSLSSSLILYFFNPFSCIRLAYLQIDFINTLCMKIL
uniref:Uncharacterized protein n=1 Tax=Rhizophora mucronata TaxID=61149 RepID=A0A2P2P4R9_RHIMU